jgi:beta-mannosidase
VAHPLKRQSLSGVWELRPVSDGQAEEAPWITHSVPDHWQNHPELRHHSGKLLYRRFFNWESAGADRDVFLRLSGVFYRHRICLNGQWIGSGAGYFFSHDYLVSHLLGPGNELLIEVDSPIERACLEKETITGVFAHWDAMSSYHYNAGGLWQDVELIERAAFHVDALQSHLLEQNQDHSRISVNFGHTLAVAFRATWVLTLTPTNFEGQTIRADGHVALEPDQDNGSFVVNVPALELWWTHDLGFPHLYQVHLALTGPDGQVSEAERLTGFRLWRMDDYVAWLNGKRLYIKGSNYAPGDVRLAMMNLERAQCDMALAKAAHMNMLRIHAHVDHPAIYQAANEAGVLLWQDFPMQWLYARHVLPEAQRQCREMVRSLGHHPSIVIWCMHNEPLHVDDTSVEPWLRKLKTYWSMLFSWNRDVMAHQLAKQTRTMDPHRTVIRSSGELWVPFWLSGTDGHYYFGWYMSYGPKRWFDLWRRLFPRNLRFVTEFGTQSFPNYENSRQFLPDDLNEADWQTLKEHYLLQWDLMSLWIDTRSRQLSDLVTRSQHYQSEILRYYVDRLRFYKYRPNGGFLNFMFTDAHPCVSWSLIDYWREPKSSYHTYAACLAPLYAFCLTPTDHYRAGRRYRLPIFAVNDQHRAILVEIRVVLTDPDENLLNEEIVELTLDADCTSRFVTKMSFRPQKSGTHHLILSFGVTENPRQENRYELVVE